MMRTAVVLALSVLVFWPQNQSNGWRGIVPLKSTREDVERLLGKLPDDDKCRCLYLKEEISVFVVYARGEPCVDSSWRVPRDTVIEFTVWEKTRKLTVADLGIDTSKFERFEDRELPGFYVLSSKELGIEYEVAAHGIVGGITYFPSVKDHHLSCDSK